MLWPTYIVTLTQKNKRVYTEHNMTSGTYYVLKNILFILLWIESETVKYIDSCVYTK